MDLFLKQIPNSVRKSHVHVFSWGEINTAYGEKLTDSDEGVWRAIWFAHKQSCSFIRIIFRFSYGGGVGHLEHQISINPFLNNSTEIVLIRILEILFLFFPLKYGTEVIETSGQFQMGRAFISGISLGTWRLRRRNPVIGCLRIHFLRLESFPFPWK